MTIPTILTIADPELARSEDICTCQHPLGHAVHDHQRVAQLTHITRRCSVCDQVWDTVAQSRHESCALLMSDGSRRYADCLIIAKLGAQTLEVRYNS